MLKNSSATLHFSAAYCSSFAKQYSEYRSLLAYCCCSIYKLMKLACLLEFCSPPFPNLWQRIFCEEISCKAANTDFSVC